MNLVSTDISAQHHAGVTSSTKLCISLEELFRGQPLPDNHVETLFQRRRDLSPDGLDILLDRFKDTGATCCFLRTRPNHAATLSLAINGSYSFSKSEAGGWSLSPTAETKNIYWVPQQPMLRRLDAVGHILSHRPAETVNLHVSTTDMGITFEVPPGHLLDLVVWCFPAMDFDLWQSLQELNNLEMQSHFLWSSHTNYMRPADLYLHLVHGHVYENHEVWPRFWRVCSELDAYALYVALSGLLGATGKRIYDLLRIQIVFSVIARQSEDGGWYHGEWTDGMESHYRLHAGAMHLLAAHFEETRDPTVGAALQKAAAFAASRTDHLESGIWYLHDSLEQNAETLKRYPFRSASSRALGKSPSNLLVLNTHLDTNIAMERCRQVSGDARHDELIASARTTTRAVLDLRPAEWLYRPLFHAIGLTFLPTKQASTLPLPLRAIKRIAWKYLIPQLPRIKALFPRLVMPGGFIERDLAQFSFSVRYQPVNLMDLVRTRRLFDEPEMDTLLDECFAFTRSSGIKDRWKELKGKEDDSLGFWAEALYHLCLAKPDTRYRAWLAEAIVDLDDNGLGLSPSLLGANAEAVAPDQQRPCPSPTDARLRLANLSRGDDIELLVVNPSNQVITLGWETPPPDTLVWQGLVDNMLQDAGGSLNIPPRGWLHGISENTDRGRHHHAEIHHAC